MVNLNPLMFLLPQLLQIMKVHEISKKKPTTPFVLCPPPFLDLMRMPPCNDNEVGKYAHKIPNRASHSPSAFHDSNPMEEILEWIIKPIVETNSKYDLDSFHPLSSPSYDHLPHDFLDQPILN